FAEVVAIEDKALAKDAAPPESFTPAAPAPAPAAPAAAVAPQAPAPGTAPSAPPPGLDPAKIQAAIKAAMPPNTTHTAPRSTAQDSKAPAQTSGTSRAAQSSSEAA